MPPAEPARPPRSVVEALLTDLLSEQLLAWQAETGAPESLDVIDLGGGTGGLAVGLAGKGHRVTVIDPSPDALASLERRAAESGLAESIRGRQGDASDLVDLLGEGAADVAVCHRVLEYVDDPAEALAALSTVLRPDGLLSLVTALRPAAVLSQALAGHLAEARAVLADPRRLDRAMVLRLVGQAGFSITAVHGIGAVATLVHESVLQTRAGAWSDLRELERDISSEPDFQAFAPYLHLSARRPQ